MPLCRAQARQDPMPGTGYAECYASPYARPLWRAHARQDPGPVECYAGHRPRGVRPLGRAQAKQALMPCIKTAPYAYYAGPYAYYAAYGRAQAMQDPGAAMQALMQAQHRAVEC